MRKSTTTNYKKRQLSIEQQNAIDLLVTGKSDKEVADAVGINRVTVTKWRLYDPFFQAELNTRRHEIWGASAERLRALLPKALSVMEEELDYGKQPWQVAAAILKLAGLEKIGAPAGKTDADKIIDGMVLESRPGNLDELIANLNGGPITEAQRQAVLADLERRTAEDS